MTRARPPRLREAGVCVGAAPRRERARRPPHAGVRRRSPGRWHTGRMRLGLLCTANVDSSQAVRDYVEFNVEAEALGFSSTFLVEHHFSGFNQVAATLMLQTLVASRTSTLRLGTGVMVLPWHNPVLLAEQAATLDVLSDGRLDLGVGKGYRHSEFRGFGIDQSEAGARFEESLGVLRRAWTSRDRFSHHGRFWSFEEIVVEPAPLQSPDTNYLSQEAIARQAAPFRGARGPRVRRRRRRRSSRRCPTRRPACRPRASAGTAPSGPRGARTRAPRRGARSGAGRRRPA